MISMIKKQSKMQIIAFRVCLFQMYSIIPYQRLTFSYQRFLHKQYVNLYTLSLAISNIIKLAIITMNQNQHELTFWLSTTFQNTIQVSLQLSRSNAPQETPYIHKYQAIELLKLLLLKDHSYKFIVHCVLGEIYSDVDQLSDSVNSYRQALSQMSRVPPNQIHGYYQYLIVIYNNLGLSYLNQDENDLGLGCLTKAEKVHEMFQEVPGVDVYHNRSLESKGRPFKFLYEGGNDHEQIEDAYTLTLFYLAQAYTKVELKDKAAWNCGRTLQRQHTTGKYQLKEFVNNLIGLSEYYQGTKYFAQAQYILMLALKVIPENKKVKLRATVHIAIGNLIGELLQFGCQRIQHKDFGANDDAIVSKQKMLFPEFEQAFPHVILPTDIEACKSLFRQANTQFKKALEVFVLDGYVTEHIEILFSQSRLYRALAILQKSGERKATMLEKRRDMLEPLLKELNPKAYPATWQKILVEVSEITNDLFSLRVALLGVKGFPSEQKIKNSFELGRTTIYYYQQIIKALEEDKETPRNEQYYRSTINSKINIAKATSKLMSSDRQKRIQLLKSSVTLYNGIIEYIAKDVPQDLRKSFEKEVELTKEMIALIPTKIDRVAYGSSFE